MEEEKWKTDIGIVCPSCGKHVQQPHVTGGEVDGSVLFREDGTFEEDILPSGYSLSCPFCEEENSFDLRKTGDWHAFPSCQHMRSARYENIGEATVVKGFFARFESGEA